MMKRMLDLFAGTGNASEIFAGSGKWVVTYVEIDDRLRRPVCEGSEWVTMDIMDIDETWISEHGPYDMVWASPPCTYFSVARTPKGFKWDSRQRTDPIPTCREAENAVAVMEHTLQIVRWANPRFFFIENPAYGYMPKFSMMRSLPMRTLITYDRYGMDYLKPTMIMGQFMWNWEPKPPTPHHRNECQPLCEIVNSPNARSEVPLQLSAELYQAYESWVKMPSRPYKWFYD